MRLLESNREPPDPKSKLYSVELQAHIILIYHFMEKKINLIVGKTENEFRVDIFIKKRENIISRTRIKIHSRE